MNRRHFIKLISIFTALFPFLKPRAEDSYRLEAVYTNPNIENALKYDNPYKLYELNLPLIKQWWDKEFMEPVHREWLLSEFGTKLIGIN